MLATKIIGRGAASRKYDILSALGAHAMAEGPAEQRLGLRFITLLTARYNWSLDVLCVGQREIARLWSVDERTVKREMALLRTRGWLQVLRQGARGRVTEYRLDLDQLLRATCPNWDRVGPDFAARMSGAPETAANVVPFAPRPPDAAETDTPGDTWGRASALLRSEDAALHQAWFRDLAPLRQDGALYVLRAPSRFHASYVMAHLVPRLLSACRRIDPSVTDLRIDA